MWGLWARLPVEPTGRSPPPVLLPRVQVEFYVNENTFKERLKLFFIKNQRSSEWGSRRARRGSGRGQAGLWAGPVGWAGLVRAVAWCLWVVRPGPGRGPLLGFMALATQGEMGPKTYGGPVPPLDPAGLWPLGQQLGSPCAPSPHRLRPSAGALMLRPSWGVGRGVEVVPLGPSS